MAYVKISSFFAFIVENAVIQSGVVIGCGCVLEAGCAISDTRLSSLTLVTPDGVASG
jgi:UDP-3-O-[3-hydroxymyristoyl] glucosamine N-acyltransferase